MLTRIAGLAVLAVAPALAQNAATDGRVPEVRDFRAELAECLQDESYLCAFDVLLDQGETEARPVAVSIEGGPTVFGQQLYSILDRAGAVVEPQVMREMTAVAVNYVLEVHPEEPWAVGPYALLNGEVCNTLGDRRCTVQAATTVELLLTSDLWYFPGLGDLEGRNDARARAEAFLADVLEPTQ